VAAFSCLSAQDFKAWCDSSSVQSDAADAARGFYINHTRGLCIHTAYNPLSHSISPHELACLRTCVLVAVVHEMITALLTATDTITLFVARALHSAVCVIAANFHRTSDARRSRSSIKYYSEHCRRCTASFSQ
jgi:hypothetical protein